MIDDCCLPLRRQSDSVYLSQIFSGLLLVTPNAQDRFFLGMALLHEIWSLQLDTLKGLPMLPQWQEYHNTWLENKKQLALAVGSKEIFSTSHGNRVGFLSHQAIGAWGSSMPADMIWQSCSIHPGAMKKIEVYHRQSRPRPQSSP